MGWSCAGGEPTNERRGDKREVEADGTGTCLPPVWCAAVTRGARHVAHRCEWRSWLLPSPPHVSPAHTRSLAFCGGDADDSQTVRCSSVTGGAFCCEYVWNDGGSLGLLSYLRLAKGSAYPFAKHVRAGISRSALCERFQAWELRGSREDASFFFLPRWNKNAPN